MQDHHPLYPDRCTRAVALCSQTEQADSSTLRPVLFQTPSHLARTQLLLVMSSMISRPWQKNSFFSILTFMTVLSALTNDPESWCSEQVAKSLLWCLCRKFHVGLIKMVCPNAILWTDYRKSYMRNRLVPKWPLFRGRLRSCQPLRHIHVTVEYFGNRWR